jgi:DNA mismatch endonuclease (patch repair protein)
VGSLCQPDYTLPDQRVACFADGDYWHCDPRKYPRGPISEAQRKNVARDRLANERLAAIGWTVARFWEHDLLTAPGACLDRLKEVVDCGNHSRLP